MDYFNSETLSPRKAPRHFTSIWLEKNDQLEHILYCMACTHPLFKYQGDVVTVVPGDARISMAFPYEFRCSGTSRTLGRCFYTYLIEGYVN